MSRGPSCLLNDVFMPVTLMAHYHRRNELSLTRKRGRWYNWWGCSWETGSPSVHRNCNKSTTQFLVFVFRVFLHLSQHDGNGKRLATRDGEARMAAQLAARCVLAPFAPQFSKLDQKERIQFVWRAFRYQGSVWWGGPLLGYLLCVKHSRVNSRNIFTGFNEIFWSAWIFLKRFSQWNIFGSTWNKNLRFLPNELFLGSYYMKQFQSFPMKYSWGLVSTSSAATTTWNNF
jgi:hypothetical protein